jgi:hypothetical protein
MESEMQWRRRMAEEKDAKAAIEGDTSGSDYSGSDIEKMANGVDRIDFFGGAGGGGTLTPEGIANSRRTRSKTIDAMDALQEACKLTGDLPPAEAAEELARVIGDAYEAGVAVDNPQMKRAAALLTALEAAGADNDADTRVYTKEKDMNKLENKLDALFDGFAPPPELDL